VLGGRYGGLGRSGRGCRTVESFLEFTGRSLDIVTGVLARECERVRLEWTERQPAS
jgi:hypothetical protein